MKRVKYQIFVSSTFEDLAQERDVVIKAILEMGHIPVGMEMFSAADEDQWQIIQRQIDDCDYYVVIVAFRYGSLDGEISYTEKEFDYARSKGVPTIGFLIQESTQWNASKVDKERDSVVHLNRFKEKIKGKYVSFWNNKDDLYGKVSISLSKQFTTNPRIGWVRAAEFAGPEVLSEISRLSRENSELRASIKILNGEAKVNHDIEISSLLSILKKNTRRMSFVYEGSISWEDSSEFTLSTIYDILAPEMMIELSASDAALLLATQLRKNKEKKARTQWPIGRNVINQIFTDLVILELVEPSSKKHKVDDQNQYWTNTHKGREVLREVRKEILEMNLKPEPHNKLDKEELNVDQQEFPKTKTASRKKR
jgi:hypothetical protein